MGRYFSPNGGGHSACEGFEAAVPKKSLTRSASQGKAKLGRALNLSRRGPKAAQSTRRVHWPRTLVQKGLGPLTLAHVRFCPQPAGTRVLHCVLLDMSTSMLKASKLAQAKGYLLALSEHAYRQRDEMAVIGFSGQGAHWVQQPAKASALGAQWIAPLGAGGGTPLHAAMGLLEPLLSQQARQGSVVCTWLLTDGRFVEVPRRPAHLQQCVVVDFDSQYVAVGKCQQLAQQWGADWQSGFGEPLLASK